jgi:hypothetical protein
MIRFRCPQCEKPLKVPEEKAGVTSHCPRCHGRYTVPAPPAAGPPKHDGGSPEAEESGNHATSPRHEVWALFVGMRPWEGAAVAVVAGTCLLGLLLPFVASLLPGGGSFAGRATPWAMLLVPGSLILLLVMLYGRASGCPSCGRWWARTKDRTEFVGREVFDRGGVSFARATYRTTFACGSCGHRWSADSTDEYKDFVRAKRPRRRLG